MHVEFVPGFCEGADQARLSEPVVQTRGGRASDIACKIYDELLHPDSASGIAFEGLALVLIAETIREVGRESNAPRWLRSVRDRLQDEYVAVPSLRQIAADAGVHPTYLATSFQQHFGVSIGEFVRLRRIEQAREMLANSDQPLGDVALLLGFSDQSHFCRTFKKQTGLSPLEYRRLFAGNPNPIQES
jgi:AraC family transcriptional regulator